MRRRKFVPYRRKREGKTNYRKRLEMLKSGQVRLVVRKSLKNITAQIVQFNPDGDKTLVSANSRELKKFGWNGYGRNTSAAYLVGMLCGVKAKKQNVDIAILDMGLNTAKSGTIIFGALKGAVESGLNIPHDPSIFPANERIIGKHISEDVAKQFETTKSNIQKI